MNEAEAEGRKAPTQLFAQRAAWFLAVLVMLAGAGVATYATGGASSPAINLFYIPIIVAAFVFGGLGGLLCASVAAYVAGPVMPYERWPEVVSQDIQLVLVRYVVFLIVALITSRLCAVVSAHAEQFANLFRVTRAVNSTLELDTVLDLITKQVRQLVDATAVVVRLLDRDRRELKHTRSIGLSPGYLAKGPVFLHESELDQRVLAGETVHIGNVWDSKLLQYPKEVWDEGLRSVVCAPLIAEGKPIGVFRVYSNQIRRYSDEQVSLIQTFANVAAVAIQQANLYGDLRSGYVQTVSALMLALEAKDPVSRGHSERVTEIVVDVAAEMGLDPEAIEVARLGALLHDIGKIGTPEFSLGGNALTPDVIQMNHPLIGRSILEPVQFLRPAIRMVECHHEYYDGTGYPQRLRGEQMPVVARILVAANEYDVLTMGIGVERITPEEGQAHLERYSGSRFDPQVVEALLKVLARRRELDHVAAS